MAEDVEGEPYSKILRYSFDGPGNHQYLVLAEHYPLDVYAVKFHLKSHSQSENKYSIVTGYGEAPSVIRTCIQIMLALLKENATASFCVLGTRSEREEKPETKRFRVYKRVLQNFFSPLFFEHRAHAEKNLYFLINKQGNIDLILNSLAKVVHQYRLD